MAERTALEEWRAEGRGSLVGRFYRNKQSSNTIYFIEACKAPVYIVFNAESGRLEIVSTLAELKYLTRISPLEVSQDEAEGLAYTLSKLEASAQSPPLCNIQGTNEPIQGVRAREGIRRAFFSAK